jgi:hypothetical protein
MEYYINLFFSVYLHVFLLFCFLTVFFWQVISKTEADSINNEIVRGINSNLKNVHISKDLFKTEAANYLRKFYEGENSVVERNNKQLFSFNISFIVLLFIGFVACIFVRYVFCGQSINWFEVITENLIILVLVGAIEYYFFMNIASKYVPVLPSYLPNVVKSEFDKL